MDINKAEIYLCEAIEEDYEVPPFPSDPTMAQIRNCKENKIRRSKPRVTLFFVVSSKIIVRIMKMKSPIEV